MTPNFRDAVTEPRFVPPFTPMPEVVPEGEEGIWRVEHFEVTQGEIELARTRSMFDWGYRDHYDAQPGQYARLLCDRSIVMSDTVMERRTNLWLVRRAHGNVLIGGLGLGMVLVPLLAKPEVEDVTVVELRPEVVKLVEPHIRTQPGGDKLTVVNEDVWEYKPPKGKKFNVVYFDIWPNYNGDLADEAGQLHRKWNSRMDRTDGRRLLSSWKYEEARYLRSQGR